MNANKKEFLTDEQIDQIRKLLGRYTREFKELLSFSGRKDDESYDNEIAKLIFLTDVSLAFLFKEFVGFAGPIDFIHLEFLFQSCVLRSLEKTLKTVRENRNNNKEVREETAQLFILSLIKPNKNLN